MGIELLCCLGLLSVTPSMVGVFVALGCLGLGGAVWIGFLWARYHSGPDPILIQRLETLERARDSAELANVELREALVELESAAGTDRLTGAWNRRRFEEDAVTLMALATRSRDPLSLVMFDLDHFKRINDAFGHRTGDMVLKGVTENVQSQLRASDLLARWGGEEFVILAPSTAILGAHALSEKIRESLATMAFPLVPQVTVSLGVAEYLPGEFLDTWIQRADQAMYRAKNGGRNQSVVIHDATTTVNSPSPSLLELHWDPRFECGQVTIDAQHRKLFDLANALLPFLTEAPLDADFPLRLHVLLAHVAQHFHEEEALLAQFSYPRLAEHAKTHRLLITRAKELQSSVGSSQLDRSALLGFLALDLIKGHILTEDRGFFSLFESPSSARG